MLRHIGCEVKMFGANADGHLAIRSAKPRFQRTACMDDGSVADMTREQIDLRATDKARNVNMIGIMINRLGRRVLAP